MAHRRVKFQDTGEYGYSDDPGVFYAPSKKYYASKEGYEQVREIVRWKKLCEEAIKTELNYTDKMYLSPYMKKRLRECGEAYGYDVLYDTILAQSQSVQWALENKNFKDDHNVASYIFAIYENNVMSEYRKKKRRLRQEQKQQYDTINAEIIEDVPPASAPRKARDVSALLGGNL